MPRRAMVADTRQRRFCVGERNPTDGCRRHGPTVSRTRSLTIIVTRSRVKTPSVEEHKPRPRDKHKPPHDPEPEQHPCGLLSKPREDRHEREESWKHDRDDDPGEPKPEPGPATQRATKHDTDETADQDGLDRKHQHHLHAANLPPTQTPPRTRLATFPVRRFDALHGPPRTIASTVRRPFMRPSLFGDHPIVRSVADRGRAQWRALGRHCTRRRGAGRANETDRPTYDPPDQLLRFFLVVGRTAARADASIRRRATRCVLAESRLSRPSNQSAGFAWRADIQRAPRRGAWFPDA